MDLLAELKGLIEALEREGVDYALCGAVALAIHGAPRATKDIDLLVPEDQLEPFRRAVKGCGFLLQSSPMRFASSGVTMQRFTKIAQGEHLMVDALFATPPLDTAWSTRERLAWDQGIITVVSRDGLISLKLLAGRPQDLADVQRLEELGHG